MGRILNRFRVRRAEKALEKGKDRKAAIKLAKAGVLDTAAALGSLGPAESAEIVNEYIGSVSSVVDPNFSNNIIPYTYSTNISDEERVALQEQANSAVIYELHEFDPTRLITKEIDPYKINNIKYAQYESRSNGLIIIDKNKELSNSRYLLNLVTSKVSQIKFDQVIDIEFKEFVTLPKADTLEIENNELRKQIALLQSRQIINLVPDTLTVNARLYSDRDGNQGNPAYPRIEDRLLSKNRTAIAVMQDDGNFVIYRGNFDTKGQQLPNTNSTPIWAQGYDQGAGNPAYFSIRHDKNSGETTLVVGGLRNGIIRYKSEVLKTSETVKAVLDDNGILNVYDGTNIVWTTFGK